MLSRIWDSKQHQEIGKVVTLTIIFFNRWENRGSERWQLLFNFALLSSGKVLHRFSLHSEEIKTQNSAVGPGLPYTLQKQCWARSRSPDFWICHKISLCTHKGFKAHMILSAQTTEFNLFFLESFLFGTEHIQFSFIIFCLALYFPANPGFWKTGQLVDAKAIECLDSPHRSHTFLCFVPTFYKEHFLLQTTNQLLSSVTTYGHLLRGASHWARRGPLHGSCSTFPGKRERISRVNGVL